MQHPVEGPFRVADLPGQLLDGGSAGQQPQPADLVLATLCLPSDLTLEEAGRLARYVESLAMGVGPTAESASVAEASSPASASGR